MASRMEVFMMRNVIDKIKREHESCVLSVAYSPDGRRIATSASDGLVRIWDAETGNELRCLPGHRDSVWSVVYSPDGRRIVSGSSDHTVRIWDVETGNELHCLRGHEDEVRCVAFSPDGRWIVSGAGGFHGDQLSPDTTVRIWDAETGAELHCLREPLFQVGRVAYMPDGRQIVCESWDSVRDEFYRYVWDWETMKFLGVTEHLFGH